MCFIAYRVRFPLPTTVHSPSPIAAGAGLEAVFPALLLAVDVSDVDVSDKESMLPTTRSEVILISWIAFSMPSFVPLMVILSLPVSAALGMEILVAVLSSSS